MRAFAPTTWVFGTSVVASSVLNAHETAIEGAANPPVVTKTANYTATVDDAYIWVDATTGTITITLPTAATFFGPLSIGKTDASVNTVIIAAAGGETIQGAATLTIAFQNTVVTLVADGTNWRRT